MELPVLNKQPKESPIRLSTGELDVIDVFRTIQGEGTHAGTPAIFIRLAGCNLDCPLCDTQYTEGRKLTTANNLALRVKSKDIGAHKSLVVISGGEPFRQDLGVLLIELIARGYEVQIETNGTLSFNSHITNADSRFGTWVQNKQLTVICSPKAGKINPSIWRHVTALKYILKAGEIDSNDGLPLSVLDNGVRPARPDYDMGFRGLIYVQPADEKDPTRNRANQDAVLASAMKFGYRISLQMHKILEVE